MSKALIQSKALKDVIQTDGVKNRLKEIMGSRAPQFAAALVQLVSQSYQLQKCDPNSVIGAALTAAALDLSIDPNLGEAHVIPYGDKAQFQIGYVGFGQLAQRSGMYKNLGWRVVHKGELVTYDELAGELTLNGEHPDDEVVGYAAKFKLVNGFERAEYWTAERIENHAMRYSQSYRYCKGKKDKEKDCRWITDRDRMALKTVLKSLLKIWGPKSIQMQKALKVDEGAIIDADAETVDFVDNPTELKTAEPIFETPAEVKLEPEKPKKEPAKDAAPKPAPEPESSFEEANPPTENSKLKTIASNMALARITEEQLMNLLRKVEVIDRSVKSLADVTPDVLDLVAEQWADIVGRVRQDIKEGK